MLSIIEKVFIFFNIIFVVILGSEWSRCTDSVCVFVSDTLCSAVASPAWAGCFAVRPAEGVPTDVRLHTSDHRSDVAADTCRYYSRPSLTRKQKQNTKHWVCSSSPSGYQKKTLTERVDRFIRVWNCLRAEVANNCKHVASNISPWKMIISLFRIIIPL